MTRDLADNVAAAMARGPDMAEFVSDYVAMLRSTQDRSEYRATMINRAKLADEIAYAWGERAVTDSDPDVVYQDVVDNARPQIEYYLS